MSSSSQLSWHFVECTIEDTAQQSRSKAANEIGLCIESETFSRWCGAMNRGVDGVEGSRGWCGRKTVEMRDINVIMIVIQVTSHLATPLKPHHPSFNTSSMKPEMNVGQFVCLITRTEKSRNDNENSFLCYQLKCVSEISREARPSRRKLHAERGLWGFHWLRQSIDIW